MQIQIQHPSTGKTKSFNYSHFLANKDLEFDKEILVDCNRGVYDFIAKGDEIIVDKHEIYDKEKAVSFDKGRRYEGIKENKKTNQFAFFKKIINEQGTDGPVLSVGCGTMYWEKRLDSDLVFFPLDISKHMLREAIDKHRTKFGIHANGANLPFADNEFSLSFCIDSLPENFYGNKHAQNTRKKILLEMNRVTKPGGKILLLLPNSMKTKFINTVKLKKFRGIPNDEYGFYPNNLKNELIDLGFEIEHFSYRMSLGPFRSQRLINYWNSLISFFRINFLGSIFAVIKVK